nr:immunoglobulin light chain junction region [Mus musculus]
CQHIRELPFTF